MTEAEASISAAYAVEDITKDVKAAGFGVFGTATGKV